MSFEGGSKPRSKFGANMDTKTEELLGKTVQSHMDLDAMLWRALLVHKKSGCAGCDLCEDMVAISGAVHGLANGNACLRTRAYASMRLSREAMHLSRRGIIGHERRRMDVLGCALLESLILRDPIFERWGSGYLPVGRGIVLRFWSWVGFLCWIALRHHSPSAPCAGLYGLVWS